MLLRKRAQFISPERKRGSQSGDSLAAPRNPVQEEKGDLGNRYECGAAT